MAETKHTFIKEKSDSLIYDLHAFIDEKGSLVISEWYYYPSDGREYEYFITILASELGKLDEYLPEVSQQPASVLENTDELLLLRLEDFYKGKKFGSLRRDFRNWLEAEKIKYEYSVW